MENQNIIEEVIVGAVVVAFQEPYLNELEIEDVWIIIKDNELTK